MVNLTGSRTIWNTTENDTLFMTGTANLGSTDGSVISLLSWDDATWILTSSFVIFTMQSGFGLLESGVVSSKNEVNIMVKNAVDVIFGGITFWMFGFGLAFGDEPLSNPFCGFGHFFVNADEEHMGYVFSFFFFQLSFATTSTTIVSGAMAERTRLISYMVFSTLNTITYCLPAHWVWAPDGFLQKLGFIDVAGAGAVHLVGGVTGLVATTMMGPRIGRFDRKEPPPLGCPTNAILGMFMLWWGWLGFNCGSTFGISGGKWKLAARAAVVTVMSSMSGGAVGFVYSYITARKYNVTTLITAILGSLVGCTAICAIAQPWEALIIGAIGALLAVATEPMLVKLKIDDPVGVIAVHAVAATWSLISVGLFTDNDTILGITQGRKGLFRGGGWYLLAIQIIGAVVIMVWTLVTSFILLKSLDMTFGLRISMEEEILGADYVEHGIGEDVLEVDTGEIKKKPLLRRRKFVKKRRSFCFKLRRKRKKERPTILTSYDGNAVQFTNKIAAHKSNGKMSNGNMANGTAIYSMDLRDNNVEDTFTNLSASSWL